MNDEDPAGDYWMAVRSGVNLACASRSLEESFLNAWPQEGKYVLGQICARLRLLRDIAQKHESDCRDKYEASIKAIPKEGEK